MNKTSEPIVIAPDTDAHLAARVKAETERRRTVALLAASRVYTGQVSFTNDVIPFARRFERYLETGK